MIGVKNREERAQHFFDTSVPLMDDGDDRALYDRVRGGATRASAAPSRPALPAARQCWQPDRRGPTRESPHRPCSGRKAPPGGHAPSSLPEAAGRPCDLPSRTFGNAASGKTLRVVPAGAASQPRVAAHLRLPLCPPLWPSVRQTLLVWGTRIFPVREK